MVQSISRALKIVRLVAESERGLRLFELADKMELKRTTVFNLAATLVKEGMLNKACDSSYQLGNMMEELSRRQGQKSMKLNLGKKLLDLHKLYPESSIVYSEANSNDIRAKIYIPPGSGTQIQNADNMQLNPYNTVCGLLYFGLLPDDILQEIKRKYPFEYWGMDYWKGIQSFEKAVEKSLKNGLSQSPATPVDILKYGVPVFESGGALSGVITFSMKKNNIEHTQRTKIFNDLKVFSQQITEGQ